VKYLYSLDNSNNNSIIFSLVSITRVLIVDIIIVEEDIIEDYIVDIVDINKV